MMTKRVVILLTILGFVVVLTELALRIFAYEQLKLRVHPAIYEEDSVLQYRHTPNVASSIIMPSIDKEFRLNNYGFNDDDFDIKKPQGVVRVAFVGNSITEGIWLDGDPFTKHLDRLLEEKDVTHIEVMNCSIGGASKSLKKCLLIEHVVLQLQPDIVFANIRIPFRNDNESRISYKGFALTFKYGSEESKQRAIAFVNSFDQSVIIKLYNASFIVRALCFKYSHTFTTESAYYLRQYIQRRYDSPDISHYAYSMESSIKKLKCLDSLLQENGSRLILYEFGKSDVYKRAAEAGLEVYSLDMDLNEQSLNHAHDGHFNEKAHKLIAQKFMAIILDLKL